MPINFPDFDSLKNRAKQRGFRQPHTRETEHQFRLEFAAYMIPIDFVEAEEIRNGVGWDQFNHQQKISMLERKIGSGKLLDIIHKLQ